MTHLKKDQALGTVIKSDLNLNLHLLKNINTQVANSPRYEDGRNNNNALNSIMSEYRIVLRRNHTPGALSVTEYAQNENSQIYGIGPLSDAHHEKTNAEMRTPEKTVHASVAGHLKQNQSRY